jgi:hypothetical protein
VGGVFIHNPLLQNIAWLIVVAFSPVLQRPEGYTVGRRSERGGVYTQSVTTKHCMVNCGCVLSCFTEV